MNLLPGFSFINNERQDSVVAVLLFLFCSSLYVFGSSGHLAPYRDTGEMACVISTLGIAHPPGYPLYTVLGQLSRFFVFGTAAYRLNVFSAVCGAGCVVVFFLLLRNWMSLGPSLVSSLFLAFSNPFWELSSVPEMYSLGVLWLASILYVFFIKRNMVFLSFLFGCGLGVRMDLLLITPLFVYFGWRSGSRESIVHLIIGFLMGLSVYMYLPVRSLQNPILDWANPDSIVAVFNSATRKNYAGTLDLLSLSYKKGENFVSGLQLYGRHLVESFGWAVGVLLPLGVIDALRKNRFPAGFFLLIFVIIGPFFFYLANMPPNPHAAAILEASFLFPDFILVFLLSFGVRFLWRRKWKSTVFLVLCSFLFVNSVGGYQRASKRDNLYGRDFIENVLRSIPSNAVAVFHKDVQLFSLWESQLLGNRRHDISLISTGLSGSPWYWEMKRRWPTHSCPEVSLKRSEGWEQLSRELSERPLVVGYDVEYEPVPGLNLKPNGLVFELVSAQKRATKAENSVLTDLCLYRGDYVYGKTPDFFSTDLIGDHARAHHQVGYFNMIRGGPRVEWFLIRSARLDPAFSRPWSDLGYYYYGQSNFAAAGEAYDEALGKVQHTLELARDYKTLPSVVSSLKMDLSNIFVHRGVVAEKGGKKDEARQFYQHSIDVHPSAQAHYNMAVTFWGEDWNSVIHHLTSAVDIDPNMEEARNYLHRAKLIMESNGIVR